jgi:hypothetical protein
MLMLFDFDDILNKDRPLHKLSNSENTITLAILVPEVYYSKYFTFYAL